MSDELGSVPEEIEPGRNRSWRGLLWGCLAAVGLLGGLIYMNRDTIGLASAIATAAGRPALLRDAEWGKPDSARSFARRFHSGAPETELLSWLRDNRSTIVRLAGSASRRIESLPCNERVDVRWAADNGGRLTSAAATVQEAGCL